jgi:hypothetical protein
MSDHYRDLVQWLSDNYIPVRLLVGCIAALALVYLVFPDRTMRVTAFKNIFAVICCGIGAAASLMAIGEVLHSSSGSGGAELPGMVGAMFLLITFLLLRRPQSVKN